MYFHLILEIAGRDKKNNQVGELNLETEEDVLTKFMVPYSKGDDFYIDGYELNKNKIDRIRVFKSDKDSKSVRSILQSQVRAGIAFFYNEISAITSCKMSSDITQDLLSKTLNLSKQTPTAVADKNAISKNVFVVHGHDTAFKNDVSAFLRKIGLSPVVLHEKASGGGTIIEKIEKYSDVGFGVVLYSECDVGAAKGIKPDLRPRARQNVVFEHGYLIGKLKRGRVCALVNGDVEKPNDISGVVYIEYNSSFDWKVTLIKELRASGFTVSMDDAFD